MISSIREVSAFGVIARIARLENGVEVIPMPEVSSLLGVNLPTINEHLSNFFGQTETIPRVPIAELRQHGMAPQGRGRPPRLITKQEFQFLVKKVNGATLRSRWSAITTPLREESKKLFVLLLSQLNLWLGSINPMCTKNRISGGLE